MQHKAIVCVYSLELFFLIRRIGYDSSSSRNTIQAAQGEAIKKGCFESFDPTSGVFHTAYLALIVIAAAVSAAPK